MKKVFKPAKFLLLLASLSCSLSVMAKDVQIGASLSNLSDKYITYLQDGINQYADEHDDVTLTLSDAAGDSALLLNQVENFIDTGVDAVVIQPTDRRIVKVVGKKLKKAGIPLIVINHYPEEDALEYLTGYVGSRERQAGVLQAEAVAKLLDGKPAKVAILMGPLGMEAQIERTAGNKEVFDKYDNIEVVAEQEGKWDRARALRIVEDWIQKDPEINVFVANNDEMALGAMLAAEKAGFKDEDVVIAGIDATLDALEHLGKGLDVTVFQDGRGQGYQGMKSAHEAALGQTPESVVWIDFENVSPDEKQKYVEKYQ